MSQTQLDRDRQEKMMRQFKRIDQFLQNNSKKFYHEYDTYNTTLVQIREQLKRQEEEMRDMVNSEPSGNHELRSVAEIDAEDGVANRLNMMTLILARIANPKLFNSDIKNGLAIQDLTHLNFRQIPLEADAILFITNPLLVFDLISDYLDYRKHKSSFIQMYITNRIARWLFRFTQFVMVYDEFAKVVQLTMLQPTRLEPYKQQMLKTIQTLCLEARDCIVDSDRPVFLNDLRRLYMILSQGLYLSSVGGRFAPTEIKEMLREIIPVISLDPTELKADGIDEEIMRFHFSSPSQREQFLKNFEQIKAHNVQYTLDFFGFIHPTDRYVIIESLYRQSKSYVLNLFLKLKKYYAQQGENVPAHYKYIMHTIQEIVRYQEVQMDMDIDSSLNDQIFWHERLYYGEFPNENFALSAEDDACLQSMAKEFVSLDVIKARIFKAFQDDAKNAVMNNGLMELGSFPFLYLSIELGKPNFNLLTLGEVSLLGVSNKGRADLIQYLLKSGQLHNKQMTILRDNFMLLSKYMQKLVAQWNLKQDKINTADHRGNLILYDFKKALLQQRELFQMMMPEFLKRLAYENFLLNTLLEIERHLARKKNVSTQLLDPEWVLQFISTDEFSPYIEALKVTPHGRQNPTFLKDGIRRIEIFKQELSSLHLIKQKLLEWERRRFMDKQDIAALESVTEVAKTDASADFLLAPYLARTGAFEALDKKPEDKKPYLIELSRIPFRYIEMEFGKPRFVQFTLTDIVAMNMNAEDRKMILDFIYMTKQLDKNEWNILKGNIVTLHLFLKQICKQLNWGKTQCIWTPSEGSFNFSEFTRKLVISDRAVRKQISILVAFKDHMGVVLEGLSEVQRLVARDRNEAVNQMQPQAVLDVLNDQKSSLQILENIKNTPFGRQYLGSVTMGARALADLRQRLIIEQSLNMRLLKYNEQFQ